MTMAAAQARAPAPALTVAVRDRLDAVDRGEWEAFLAAAGAEICFAPDWQEAWWAHYGASFAPSRRLRLIEVREGAALVGLLPFCVETLMAGPIPVRLARPAGTDPNFAVMALPLAEGREEPVLAAAFARLAAEGCDALAFAPLSERSPHLAALRAALAAAPDWEIAADAQAGAHTLMTLPDSFDAFFAALSKSRRREHRRDLRKLTEAAPLTSRSSTPETVEARFAAFVALHAAQWRAAGKGGHYADWSRAEAFHGELLRRLAPSGRAHVDEQFAGEELLSSQLRFTQGPKALWWLNARSIAPRFEGLGVGRIGLVERVGELIEAGVRLVDAGAGEYDYKLSYGGELVPLRRIVAARATPAGRLKARALAAWADLWNLVYYRAWFLKIAPRLRARLGGRPGALRRGWIRTRL